MRTTAAILFGSALLVSGHAERAFGSAASSNSVACGSTAAGWNAPNGTIVFSRGGGPVRNTIDAIGEYRTHTMVSHGPGGWTTHASMFTPGTNGWPTYCSTPLNADELKNGYPGASQQNQGAIYVYLYSGGDNQYLAYQLGNNDGTNKGATVANYIWNSLPYQWVTSAKDGGQGLYRVKYTNGSLTNYSLYQYKNLDGVSTDKSAVAWNSGIVCSTLIAYAQNQSVWAVNPFTYDHNKLVAGGNGIYNGVKSDCDNNMGWMKGVGAAITCFEGICDDAGRQVRNCMATGVCNSDDSGYWDGVANNSATTATSVSPDRIGGWGGHPTSVVNGNSVWAYSGGNTVQWNSGGNSYGCWY
jgi:hypothetical protein